MNTVATNGIILAGGQSVRMGGVDKCFAELAGKSLLARAIERARPQVSGLAIGASGDSVKIRSLCIPVIADAVPNYAGPLAGILSGLEWGGDRGGTRLATFAVDAPFFPTDLVARLGDAAVAPDMISVAVSHGRAHYVFGVWPTTLAADLRSHLESGDRRSVRGFLDRHNVVKVDFPASSIDPFFNINTPDDLAAAEQMLGDDP